jgi:methyl-accepting chemotaxis protein
MVTEIAQASKEQAQGVKEINTAISQLDQVTQQNSAVAQQSSTQAETLLNETNTLKSIITELTAFVNGNGQTKTSPSSSEMPKQKNTPKEPKKSSVVSMSSFKKAKDKQSPKKEPAVHDVKVAANSDVTPSNSDPGFENF